MQASHVASTVTPECRMVSVVLLKLTQACEAFDCLRHFVQSESMRQPSVVVLAPLN
jgi:hypothetical protein